MPKRKVKRIAAQNKKFNTLSEGQVNFTFFNSKLFVSLIAIALVVIAFAVITSLNNTSTDSTNDNYRINTTNLKNDPSANQVKVPQK